LKKHTKLPFIDLIEETVKKAKNYANVGILCSSKTRDERLYDKYLGEKIIYPSIEEQKKVSGIIINIIRNRQTKKDKEYLDLLIERLIQRGAKKVILACTDLSIIANKNTIDTTEVLIKAVLREMHGRQMHPN
jgi:aspartate/glutamate racemase